jgi:hypothetical protein
MNSRNDICSITRSESEIPPVQNASHILSIFTLFSTVNTKWYSSLFSSKQLPVRLAMLQYANRFHNSSGHLSPIATTCRHFGKFEQAQNHFPACCPFAAWRFTMTAEHIWTDWDIGYLYVVRDNSWGTPPEF